MGYGESLWDHKGDWIFGFSTWSTSGDLLWVELLPLKEGLMLAWNRGLTSLLCESDYFEVVQLFSQDMNYTLHIHAELIFQMMRFHLKIS
uniref:RNase H type-1 domain-containing protein n=1 Tax=Cajanus cajan TaxID=3821 RepID=A0A151RLJ7_CAJCA|nr:hypothetical protein KK1_035196 [Cajanus cajan]